jgi:hypothetical protein
MAAVLGAEESLGSGRIALAQSDRTLPGVSAPSSVVRSIMEMARSIAYALAEVLIDLVPREAARDSRPTASMPGSPCRKRRRVASEEAASASPATAAAGGLGGMLTS